MFLQAPSSDSSRDKVAHSTAPTPSKHVEKAAIMRPKPGLRGKALVTKVLRVRTPGNWVKGWFIS